MAAAPSSCPVPPMTKDQKEVESNKRGTRLSEGFCEEWSQKSKGHVWFPLSNLPLLRRLGLYRRRLMLSISIGRYLGLAFAISSFEGRRFNRKAPLSTATAIAIESAISHYSDTTHPDPISHFPLLRFPPSAKVELTGLARATRRGLPVESYGQS